MLKSLFLAALFLAAPILTLLPASAEAATYGTLTGSGTCVATDSVLYAPGAVSSFAVTLSGTWAGTVTFKGSVDGVTYSTVTVTPNGGGAGTTTATANGTWTFPVGANTSACFYFSAYTSGSASVAISATSANQDTVTTGSLTASGATCSSTKCVIATLGAGQGVALVTVTGTWTATLTFEATGSDGTTVFAVNGIVPSTAATAATTTVNGTWFIPISGYQSVQVRCSAYTSGTAVVSIQASKAASPGLSTVSLTAGNSLKLLDTGGTNLATIAPVDTAAGNGLQAYGGEYITPLPTRTSGRVSPVTLDVSGGMLIAGEGSVGSAPVGNPVVIAGTDGTNTRALKMDTSGDAVVVGSVADGAAIAGNPVPIGFKAVADAAAPTQVTAGQEGYGLATLERIPITTTRHPNHFSCIVTNSGATTLTAFVAQGLNSACTAPGAGLSLYITDISAYASAASGTTADNFLELKEGTGVNCVTGTLTDWSAYNVLNGGVEAHWTQPLKVTPNTGLCWMDAVTGNKSFTVSGYIAP